SCGLLVQVPAGGRRLCGCGAWLSADDAPTSAPRGAAEIVPAMPVMTAVAADAPSAEPVVAIPAAIPTAQAHAGPRIEGDLTATERLKAGYRRIRKELAKAIVGQERVLEELLISIFARGHCLLVGVPGLAKTLMIRTLADSLSL